jgi:hypothetical protein
MKKVVIIFLSILSMTESFAQKESFDIASYQAPKAWKKEKSEGGIQFTKEDAKTGAYCLITLFKSVASTASAMDNFEMAWASILKEMVNVTNDAEMQPPATEDGWEVLSGYSPFENDGNKGVAVLVTSTGSGKMVNIVVLTNTDAYEKDMTAFLESITLKKQTVTSNTKTVVKKTVEPPGNNSPAKATGFAFNTTNFDNGWTSVVQEDWVEVTNVNFRVLLHYPNQAVDRYSADLMEGLKNAWNVLIAPRYSSATNMQFRPVSGWQSIQFAEATMVEKGTGKTVYVVFFKKNYHGGVGRYIEFITADKRTFEQEFGTYENAKADFGDVAWDKMAAMANYNKFAVAASDLKGKWTTNFTGMTQYVNANTGADAGMNTHASTENFAFGAGNTYKWDLTMASGFVGNIKFQGVKSNGKFTVLNNWQVKFSDIEGKPKTYNVQFVCIKGARVLWIGESGFGKKE